MGTIKFEEAKAEISKIKIGLRGASGSGKTMGALLIAYGLTQDWSKIFLIDTETSAGLLKNKTGPFQRAVIKAPYSTESFLEYFDAAKEAGAEVIIFDSISHWWSGPGGVLDMQDKLTRQNRSKSSFAIWNETTSIYYTPLITKVIMQEDVHVIFTMRTKTDYVIQYSEAERKTRIEKVGLKEDIRENFDYELSIYLNIAQNHVATGLKDRLGIFTDKEFVITEDTGKQIKDWLEQNIEQPTQEQVDIEREETRKLIIEIEYYMPVLSKFNEKVYNRCFEVIKQRNKAKIKEALEYIAQNKDAIKECVKNEAFDYIQIAKSKEELKHKIMIKSVAPQIVKDHPDFKAYFASLVMQNQE